MVANLGTVLSSGKVAFAHTGDITPWHGMGQAISPDMTIEQIAALIGIDSWEAVRTPLVFRNPAWKFGEKNQFIDAGRDIITRSDNGHILAQSVSSNWNPPVNKELIEAAVKLAADMGAVIKTAGVLGGGEVVWIMAKLGDNYKIANELGQQYVFISASFKYGLSSRADFTNTIIVCRNTFMAAMSDKSDHGFNMTHRQKYTAAAIAEWFKTGEADLKLQKAQAEILAGKKASDDDVKEFFAKIFPLTSKANLREKEISRNAELALVLNEDSDQPGQAERGDTWWRAFNTVTFMVDHELTRSDDTRMFNAMLGTGRSLKIKAMNTALEAAGASADLAMAA